MLAFTTGAGVLIYRNAGSLAHIFNNLALTAIMLACFWYAGKWRSPFTPQPIPSPTPYYNYVVLVGALLFLMQMHGYLHTVNPDEFGFPADNHSHAHEAMATETISPGSEYGILPENESSDLLSRSQ